MTADGRERRRRTRVALNGEVSGRIHTVSSAPVVDLSETGALIEVPCVLRPGTIYTLRLPVGEDHVNLQSRVVRSYVHGFDHSAGEPMVRYRAAMEFVGLGEHERKLLARHFTDTDMLEEDFEE